MLGIGAADESDRTVETGMTAFCRSRSQSGNQHQRLEEDLHLAGAATSPWTMTLEIQGDFGWAVKASLLERPAKELQAA